MVVDHKTIFQEQNMKLSDVDFDEFVEWLDKFETVQEDTERLLIEAGKEVPIIDRLLKIMWNAEKNNGPKDMIKRTADQIQCLAALYHLEKKQDAVQNN
jgi:hypothetical protein